LDRYTSQNVSSNKKQPCQERNFDLHDNAPQFPSSRQAVMAKHVPNFLVGWKDARMQKFKKFSDPQYAQPEW
jgi:hypothetical protein